MKNILVVGSLNMDTVIEVVDMPKLGETITGKSITYIPGGKGANQAYAVGKLGGHVAMIGTVGKEEIGDILKKNLELVNVNTEGIESIEGVPSGQAFIPVTEKGDNSIILISGTNALLTKEQVMKYEYLIDQCDVVMMQLEIPLETVNFVKEYAIAKGKKVIIDPAPVKSLGKSFWKGIDYIKPNEVELETLVGRSITCPQDVEMAAREMLSYGIKNVIVTLGGKGCFFVNGEEEFYIEAEKVNVVDTTAAGDSFTAAFAIAICEEKTHKEALKFASRVAAIAVSRKGAQSSIPSREEL